MLTKKQQWRRTKSIKYSFPDGTPLECSFEEPRKGDAAEYWNLGSSKTSSLYGRPKGAIIQDWGRTGVVAPVAEGNSTFSPVARSSLLNLAE